MSTMTDFMRRKPNGDPDYASGKQLRDQEDLRKQLGGDPASLEEEIRMTAAADLDGLQRKNAQRGIMRLVRDCDDPLAVVGACLMGLDTETRLKAAEALLPKLSPAPTSAEDLYFILFKWGKELQNGHEENQ